MVVVQRARPKAMAVVLLLLPSHRQPLPRRALPQEALPLRPPLVPLRLPLLSVVPPSPLLAPSPPRQSPHPHTLPRPLLPQLPHQWQLSLHLHLLLLRPHGRFVAGVRPTPEAVPLPLQQATHQRLLPLLLHLPMLCLLRHQVVEVAGGVAEAEVAPQPVPFTPPHPPPTPLPTLHPQHLHPHRVVEVGEALALGEVGEVEPLQDTLPGTWAQVLVLVLVPLRVLLLELLLALLGRPIAPPWSHLRWCGLVPRPTWRSRCRRT
jgi:hypothetical protein